MNDLNELARRYIAIWNEPDASARRDGIERLWVEDGEHFTDIREVYGHDDLEERVGKSYEQWVRPGEYVFRAVANANGHHNVVRFNWEMVEIATGAVKSVGFDFLVLNDDGRIVADYQFIDS